MRKIVILGAGFGGLRTALDLVSYNIENTKIVLIDKTPNHDFHADLYEVAASYIEEKESKRLQKLAFENIYGSVAIPIREIIDGKDIEFIQDEVVGLKPKVQKISLKKDGEIDYDYLVMSLGSITNFFNIPNLDKIAFPLKSVDDALNIRNSLDEIFYRKKKLEPIRIVVGGGGFTGCELAAELSDFVKKLAILHKHPLKLVEISIIEACPRLLNGTKPELWKVAQKRLVHLGIKLMLNSKITNAGKNSIVLENKKSVPFDLLIWTAGVKANPLVSKLLDAQFEREGCIVVDKYLQILPFNNVFGVGDNTYCFDDKNQCPLPQTASVALSQAKICALNIYRKIKKEEVVPYRPPLARFVIPLGQKFAIADLGFITFYGFWGWFSKKLISLKYFLSILPLSKALSLWLFGTWVYAKND